MISDLKGYGAARIQIYEVDLLGNHIDQSTSAGIAQIDDSEGHDDNDIAAGNDRVETRGQVGLPCGVEIAGRLGLIDQDIALSIERNVAIDNRVINRQPANCRRRRQIATRQHFIDIDLLRKQRHCTATVDIAHARSILANPAIHCGKRYRIGRRDCIKQDVVRTGERDLIGLDRAQNDGIARHADRIGRGQVPALHRTSCSEVDQIGAGGAGKGDVTV